jgi:hypothetical protein
MPKYWEYSLRHKDFSSHTGSVELARTCPQANSRPGDPGLGPPLIGQLHAAPPDRGLWPLWPCSVTPRSGRASSRSFGVAVVVQ